MTTPPALSAAPDLAHLTGGIVLAAVLLLPVIFFIAALVSSIVGV